MENEKDDEEIVRLVDPVVPEKSEEQEIEKMVEDITNHCKPYKRKGFLENFLG